MLKSSALELNRPPFPKANEEPVQGFHWHGHKPHEDHERNPTMASHQKGFELQLNATNAQFNCTKSPILHVNGMGWTLELCKSDKCTNQNGSLIAIQISPSVGNENASFRWSCEANAAIEFHSLVNTNKSVFFAMPTQKFTNNGPLGYEICTEMEWQNFTREYVNSGGDVKVHLDIASTRMLRVPDVEQNSAKFRFLLDEVSELRSEFSKKIRVRDINWQILVKRNHGALGVYLQADKDDMDIDSAWPVTACFEILSMRDVATPNPRSFNTTFHRRMTNYGFSQFKNWDDFMNPENKYVEMDAAIFGVELKVNEPKPLWGQ